MSTKFLPNPPEGEIQRLTIREGSELFFFKLLPWIHFFKIYVTKLLFPDARELFLKSKAACESEFDVSFFVSLKNSDHTLVEEEFLGLYLSSKSATRFVFETVHDTLFTNSE